MSRAPPCPELAVQWVSGLSPVIDLIDFARRFSPCRHVLYAGIETYVSSPAPIERCFFMSSFFGVSVCVHWFHVSIIFLSMHCNNARLSGLFFDLVPTLLLHVLRSLNLHDCVVFAGRLWPGFFTSMVFLICAIGYAMLEGNLRFLFHFDACFYDFGSSFSSCYSMLPSLNACLCSFCLQVVARFPLLLFLYYRICCCLLGGQLFVFVP